MTYKREIPRDLFNEANLLKCFGQLYLELEKLNLQHLLKHTCKDQPFGIRQEWSDGSLSIDNVWLSAPKGQFELKRPLNSREPYPLYALLPGEDETEISVFNDDGTLTVEMIDALTN